MNVCEHIDLPECGPISYRIFDSEDVIVKSECIDAMLKNTIYRCDICRIVIYVFALIARQFSAPKFIQI